MPYFTGNKLAEIVYNVVQPFRWAGLVQAVTIRSKGQDEDACVVYCCCFKTLAIFKLSTKIRIEKEIRTRRLSVILLLLLLFCKCYFSHSYFLPHLISFHPNSRLFMSPLVEMKSSLVDL